MFCGKVAQHSGIVAEDNLIKNGAKSETFAQLIWEHFGELGSLATVFFNSF